MQPHVNDMSSFSVLKKMGYVGLLSFIPEVISSPFERLKVRCFAR